MKTSYLTFFERTILASIVLEAYDIFIEGEEGNGINSATYDQIQEVYKIFLKEGGYNIPRVGEITAFKDWLQGLPTVLTVPFSNYEILQNGLMEGFNLSTEDKEDLFLEDYWGKLAKAFFVLKDNL